MKYISTGQSYVIRCFNGEEIISVLTGLCEQENITSGWIWGLGAVKSVILGYFDMELKSYVREELEEDFEIVQLTGNVAIHKDKLMFHLHICLADGSFNTLGGHLFSAEVGATAELLLTPFSNPLIRTTDTQTGLNLLELE